MAEAEAEDYKFSIWVEAPHDQVWRAIRQQIEHPRTGDKSGIKQVVVLEHKKNLLVREIVPARGKRFQEKITFISNQKAITDEKMMALSSSQRICIATSKGTPVFHA